MIPLSDPLDTIDFDALVEIARSRLPMLAPEWTDYNYSDPGITLIELLAWIADSQVYSIGRNRRDEKTAMAALLGIAAEGARPAAGTVFPVDGLFSGQIVAAGTKLVPAGSPAPRIEVAYPVALHGLKLAAIVSEGPGGPVDHGAANEQPRASYAPFGAPPTRDAALHLVLKGDLGSDPVSISLGFELEEDDQSEGGLLGEIKAMSVAQGGAETPTTIAYDSTFGLRRSGVMILALPAGSGGQSEHHLRFRSTRAALMPRLLRIAPNALPVLQQASLSPDPFDASGRAGQTLVVEPLAHFDQDEAAEGHAWRLASASSGSPPDDAGLALNVQVQDGTELKTWERGDFESAVDTDAIYEVDERADGTRIAIRFGNGVNGRRPAPGAQIVLGMRVSAGKTGNIAAGIEWRLDGFGARWRNSEAIDGARDANDLDALLARLRATLRLDRTLATSAQIEAAARELPKAFGIDRAAVVEGWEPGRRRPAWPATRTLLVTRRGAEGGAAAAVETDDWRRAIGEQLRPRIALAERLIVATPVRRPLRVRVAAVAAPGRVPAAVAKEIRDELALRFSPGGGRKEVWPLGRDVTTMAVGGWIRRLQGVAMLSAIALLDENGQELADGVFRLGRNELPLLAPQAEDIRVAPEAAR